MVVRGKVEMKIDDEGYAFLYKALGIENGGLITEIEIMPWGLLVSFSVDGEDYEYEYKWEELQTDYKETQSFGIHHRLVKKIRRK